jgi:hypothetical protein
MNLDYRAQQRQIAGAGEELRHRDFMTQTDKTDHQSRDCQTDDAYFKKLRQKEANKERQMITKPVTAQAVAAPPQDHVRRKSGYQAHEAKKRKMREALIKPSYNVANLYHTKGCCQWIARHHMFENATFLVILINAMWIAVDTDHNHSVVLLDADPVFKHKKINQNMFQKVLKDL